MSTTSSGLDISAKYQKLAAEFSKLRAHVVVLKKAVVDEQEKSKALSDQLSEKDQQLRSCSSEIESLTFRNQQLSKRVESLQEHLSEPHNSNSSTGGRFFRRASMSTKHRNLPQSISSDLIFSSTNHNDESRKVLEEELKQKLEDNERLNKQISALENAHQTELVDTKERIRVLEQETETLRAELSNIKSRHDAVLNDLRQEKRQLETAFHEAQEDLSESRSKSQIRENSLKGLETELNQIQHLVSNTIVFNDQDSPHLNRLNVTTFDVKLAEEFGQCLKKLQPSVVQALTHLGLFHSYCKQRTQLYPCDASLEQISETNQQYAALLDNKATLLRSIAAAFEALLDKCQDVKSIANLTVTDFKSVLDILSDYKEFLLRTLDFVKRTTEEECAVSWCNNRLENENAAFAVAYEKFVKSVDNVKCALEQLFIPEQNQDIAMQSLADSFVELDCKVKELFDQYSMKIVHEHLLPVATRQLRTTNECIGASLNSLSKHVREIAQIMKKSSIFVQFWTSFVSRLPEWAKWQRKAANYYQMVSSIATTETSETIVKNTSDPRLPVCVPWKTGFNFDNDNLASQWKTQLEEKQKQITALEREKEKWAVEAQLLRMKMQQLQQQVAQKSEKSSTSGDINSREPSDGPSSVSLSDDGAYIEEYYGTRIADLSAQLQEANGRSVYLHSECQYLLRNLQSYQKQKETLQRDLKTSAQETLALKEDLETTRKGYENQLSTLSEHLAQMNQNLTKKTDEIDMLRQAMLEKTQKKGKFK